MRKWCSVVVVVVATGLGVARGQDAPQGRARISGGVEAGQIETRVNPVYPPIAVAAGVEGAVVLHAIIDSNGTVDHLTVIAGPEMLRQAALEAVRQWIYRPYLLNGVPTAVDTTVTVNFNLDRSARQGQASASGSNAALGAADKAAPGGPVRISGGMMAGSLLSKVSPAYPAEAKKQHISGSVKLHAIIGKDGRIARLTVISGPKTLQDSAIEAVGQWVYRPYLLNGEPTEVDTTITVNYGFSPSIDR